MIFGEKSSCDFCVRLWHRVSVYHTSNVTSVTWNLLLADLVSRARNPILGSFARISKYILVDLGTGRQISLTHHGLLERNAPKVCLIAT